MVKSWLSHSTGGQVSWIPTLVTVPAATGPKSQATGPELLLIELLEGVAACAERRELSCANQNTRNEAKSRVAAAIGLAERTSRMGDLHLFTEGLADGVA